MDGILADVDDTAARAAWESAQAVAWADYLDALAQDPANPPPQERITEPPFPNVALQANAALQEGQRQQPERRGKLGTPILPGLQAGVALNVAEANQLAEEVRVYIDRWHTNMAAMVNLVHTNRKHALKKLEEYANKSYKDLSTLTVFTVSEVWALSALVEPTKAGVIIAVSAVSIGIIVDLFADAGQNANNITIDQINEKYDQDWRHHLESWMRSKFKRTTIYSLLRLISPKILAFSWFRWP
ncbi:MAG: hypothetical protein ACK4RK_10280 [Gemmataceae bacterium]